MHNSTPAELYQAITQRAHARRARRRARRVTLPWAELEAEAARQDCSPADIFFDLAGHDIPSLPDTPPPPTPPAS